jgi:hypothetical protein
MIRKAIRAVANLLAQDMVFWAMAWAQAVVNTVAYVSCLMHLIPEPVLKDFFTYNVAIISCPMLGHVVDKWKGGSDVADTPETILAGDTDARAGVVPSQRLDHEAGCRVAGQT